MHKLSTLKKIRTKNTHYLQNKSHKHKRHTQTKYIKNTQIGGKPNITHIDLLQNFPIELFEITLANGQVISDFGLLLNPLYGCVLSYNFIPSVYKFAGLHKNDIINRLFTANGTHIVPSKNEILAELTAFDIGYILAYLFIQKHTPELLQNKQPVKKSITQKTNPRHRTMKASNPPITTTNLSGLNKITLATGETHDLNEYVDMFKSIWDTKQPSTQNKRDIGTTVPLIPSTSNSSLELNIIGMQTKINKFFDKIKLPKTNPILDIKTFHTILAFLWSRSTTMDDIINYFTGLRAKFSEHTIYMPTIELIDNISINPLAKDKILFPTLPDIIKVIKSIFYKSIHIITTDTTNIPKKQDGFSDCMETTIRSFINFLLFDVKIPLDNLTPTFKEYYTIFSTHELHNKNITREIPINGELYNDTARNIWGGVLLHNLPGIEYNTRGTRLVGYNILSSIPNFINTLKIIFGVPSNDKLFEVFDTFEISILYNEQNYGNIKISYKSTPIAIIKAEPGHISIEPIHITTTNIIPSEYKYLYDICFYSTENTANKSTIFNVNPTYGDNIINIFFTNITSEYIMLLLGWDKDKYDTKLYTRFIAYLINTSYDDTCIRLSDFYDMYYIDFNYLYTLINHISPIAKQNMYKLFIEFSPETNAVISCIFNLKYPSKKQQSLPDSITRLFINGYKFNFTEGFEWLPSSVNKIILTNTKRKTKTKFDPSTLPSNITQIIFDQGYIITSKFPEHITHLTFGDDVTSPEIAKLLPKSLVYLDFGYSFNNILNLRELTPSLEELRINKIELDITNPTLPSTIKTIFIYLRHTFNKYIDYKKLIESGYKNLEIHIPTNRIQEFDTADYYFINYIQPKLDAVGIKIIEDENINPVLRETKYKAGIYYTN